MATPAPLVQKVQVSLVYVARCLANGLAKEFGYRAIGKLFGIRHITIRRWSMAPEERDAERRKTLERNRERQYGYAFPVHTQIQMQYPDETQM